jgi:hypothetical protein
MKELEDYVNEKKNRYLDEISDFEQPPKDHSVEHKFPSPELARSQLGNDDSLKRVKGQRASRKPSDQIDVQGLCDQMIKDLSHLDKQLENRQSDQYTPQMVQAPVQIKDKQRQSLHASKSKQEANDLLNTYLNSYQNEQKSKLDKSSMSHVSQKSKKADLQSAREQQMALRKQMETQRNQDRQHLATKQNAPMQEQLRGGQEESSDSESGSEGEETSSQENHYNDWADGDEERKSGGGVGEDDRLKGGERSYGSQEDSGESDEGSEHYDDENDDDEQDDGSESDIEAMGAMAQRNR